MTEEETRVLDVKEEMDEKDFDLLVRFFTAISEHPEEPELSRVYLTQESILTNCPKYWGHPCEWFAKRLHGLLSGNVPCKRIFFKTFKERFYDTLINPENTNKEKSSFIFKMLDIDQDGVLNASDLLRSYELISMDSRFGKELSRLMEWFTDKNIKVTTFGNKEIITTDMDFSQFI